MKGRTLLLALALLLLPTVAAEGGLHASVVELADARGWDAGALTLQRTTAQAPAQFDLRAASLRVETDQRDAWTPVAWTDAETTRTLHASAHAVGTAAGPEGRLFVVAQGPLAFLSDASCGRTNPVASDETVYAPRVGARPAIRVPLATAVAWTPCADAAVTLHGDLLLVLWEWDARLTSDQGTTTLDSGRGDPASGDAGAREHFLFARNATLTLPPARQTVYVEDLHATAGTVRLTGASGELDGAPVDGDLSLSGEVEVLVQGRGVGQPMAVSVGGTVREAMLGDATLATAAEGRPWWPWLLAGGLGAGAVGVVRVRPHLHYLHAERTGGELGSLIPQTLRQRRAVGLWLMARSAEGRRWFRSCRRRATKANDLFRPFPEAQFTRAVAAGALGQHADAMTDFVDLYHRYDDPLGRAAAACGMAQQCCRINRWGGGEEWLRMAAAESFSYTHQASLSPEFDHYVGQPWFDALRRGEARSLASGSASGADPSVQ